MGEKQRLVRKHTLNERLYEVAEKISPPFAIQMVIEGEGLLIESEFRKAVTELSTLIPAMCYQSRAGAWYEMKKQPEVVIHTAQFTPAHLSSVCKSKFQGEESGSCEFHLFQGASSTLLIRVVHRLMDGEGVLIMMRMLFQLLNQQKAEAFRDYPKDETYRQGLKVKAVKDRDSFAFRFKALQNQKLLSGDYQFGLVSNSHQISQVISKLAAWYVEQTSASARFLIPVNARRHNANTRTVANLSFPIYLDALENEHADDLHAKLLTDLSENNELAPEQFESISKYAPVSLLSTLFKQGIKRTQTNGKFPLSGYLSDLGYIDLDQFATPDFTSTNMFSLPVFVPLAPFCAIMCTHKNGTRIGISVPTEFDLKKMEQSMLETLETFQAETIKPEGVKLSALAQQIRFIWAELLSKEEGQIGIFDTYSELGGTSLNLLFLIDRVEKEIIGRQHNELMPHVVILGGKLTIAKLEEIILNLPPS
jgi:hypothetical protein